MLVVVSSSVACHLPPRKTNNLKGRAIAPASDGECFTQTHKHSLLSFFQQPVMYTFYILLFASFSLGLSRVSSLLVSSGSPVVEVSEGLN